MGVSTDAILAFGIDLGEETPAFLEEFDGQWDEFVASQVGLEPPNGGDYDEASKPEWHKYWDAKRQAEKAFPLTLITHCSGEYPMYFLAYNGTEQRASRGDTTVIEPAKLVEAALDLGRLKQLMDFCAEHGLEDCNGQPPSWRLFSYWS